MAFLCTVANLLCTKWRLVQNAQLNAEPTHRADIIAAQRRMTACASQC